MAEKFELLDHLGTSYFAQTWRARVIDTDLIDEWGEGEVAIKIPLTKQKERSLRKELVLKASLHLKLKEMESKNIVKYLGFEIFDGKLVMVTEYVSGGNLRAIIGPIGRWKKLPVETAIEILDGILEGLSIIHKANILHSRIEPNNILMSGRVAKISVGALNV